MSHNSDEHPSPKILAAFADGCNLGEDLPELEHHIAGCAVCATSLASLESDHSLARQVGSAIGKTLVVSEDEVSLAFLEPSPRPGALGRIGHHHVLEVLGRGGFGIVLKAFDDSLQRIVALKILAPVLAASSSARKRFLREARSAAAVRHENVVQIYSVHEQPLPYLVMEYIPGENLQQRLDRTGPFEADETRDIGRQIAAGLAAAHSQGLVHRDIKPANVLLDSSLGQRVKITDFGLARAADDASLTQSGLVIGTPMYMAPEQARGDALDHRTDLFSLGSVLYVMLCGRPPFRAPNTVAILKRVCDDTPCPIPELIPDVSVPLCQIIGRLHAKRPEDRIQTAQEVVDLLSQNSAQPPNTPLEKDSADIASQSARVRTRRWVAAGVAALAVVLLIVTSQFSPSGWIVREDLTHAATSPDRKEPQVALSLTDSTVSSVQRQEVPAIVEQSPRLPVNPDGMALQFDGRTSYVQVATLSRRDPSPATLEAWVRPEIQPGSQVIALLSGKSLLQIGKSSSAFFPIEINARLSRREENPPFVPGEWVHVAVVADERELRIYTNGTNRLQIARDTAPVQSPHGYDEFWLGGQPFPGRSDPTICHFKGQLDEIRVSNIARYGENFTPEGRFTPDANTLALYHCDEGSGTELRDASGHNHHGKVVAVEWVDRANEAEGE